MIYLRKIDKFKRLDISSYKLGSLNNVKIYKQFLYFVSDKLILVYDLN